MVNKETWRLPLRGRLSEAIEGELQPHFNGGYGTFPAWTPSSALWSIEGEIDTATDIEYPAMLTSDEGKTWALYLNTSVSFMLKYSDSLGTQYESASIAGGITGRFRLDVFPDKLVFAANGEEYTKSIPGGILQPPGFVTAGCYGSNSPSNFFKGEFFWLRFIDHTPLQGCRVMGPAANKNRHPKTPPFTLAGDFELTAHFIFASASAQRFFGHESDWDFEFSQNTNDLAIKVPDGAGGSHRAVIPVSSLAEGNHYKVVGRRTGTTLELELDGVVVDSSPCNTDPVVVETVYWQNATWYTGGIGFLKARDLETGDVYEYDNRNDPGNLLVNRSERDVLSAELIEVNSTTSWDGTEAAYANQGFNFTPDPAAVYRVVVDTRSGIRGSIKVNTGGVDTPFVGAGNLETFDLRGLSGFTQAQVAGEGYEGSARFSIRRIHALATAEGPELVTGDNASFTGGVGDWQADPVEGSIEIAAENGRLKLTGVSGGTEGAKLTNAGYLEAGKQYRVRVTLENLVNDSSIFLRGSFSGNIHDAAHFSLQAGLNTAGVPYRREAYFTPTQSGWFHLYALVYEGGAGYWDDISLKEVTHGIWHESGALMDPATANAARTYLPPINRTYDLSRMPAIAPAESKLQGGYFIEGKYAPVPEMVFTGAFKYDFWWPRKERTGTNSNVFLGHTGLNHWVAVFDSGSTAPDEVGISLGGGGVYTTTGAANVPEGTLLHIEVERDAADNVVITVNGQSEDIGVVSGDARFDMFAAQGSTNNITQGPLSAVLRDLETGHVYRYNNKNDSGDVLWNSASRDVLGEELATVRNIAPGAPLDVSIDNWGYYEPASTDAIAGAVYRVTADIVGNDSGVPVGWSTSVGAPGAHPFRKLSGTVGGDFKATSNAPFRLFFDRYLDSEVGFSNISIRRIHEIATAEGEELYSGPEKVAKVDANQEFPLDAALVIGNHYLVSFTYDNNASYPGVKLGSTGVDNQDQLEPDVSGAMFYGVLKCESNSNNSLFITGPASDATIYNLSVKPVTHGLWQNVDYVGPNLIAGITPSPSPEFTVNGDGSYTADGSQAAGIRLTFPSALPASPSGRTFLCAAKVEREAGVTWWSSNSDASETPSDSGYVYYTLTKTDDTDNINLYVDSTFIGTVRPLWVKELNPASGETTVYRKYLPPLPKRYLSQGDVVVPSDVEGPELIDSNPTFDSDLTGWGIISGGWSANNGRAELTGDGTAQVLTRDGVFEIGKPYWIEFDVYADSSFIGVQDASNTLIENLKGNSGRVSGVWVADTSNLRFKREGGTVNGWIDNVSVRETNAITFTGIEADDWK